MHEFNEMVNYQIQTMKGKAAGDTERTEDKGAGPREILKMAIVMRPGFGTAI
jgi:hypothetical protein